LNKQWCIPPETNAAFVCQMEDVLAVYQRAYDLKRPVVCMDESSKQLLADVRAALPMEAGQVQRYDYEYIRQGVANLFIFFAPLENKRRIKVTDHRCRRDWAEAMRELSDEDYPDAEKIVVVMDNLNTHSPISFYETFSPEEARRLVERFEFHYTPKHGSWLNMAEIEFSVLTRQCLNRRNPNTESLIRKVQAWTKYRNEKSTSINWRFTTEDARIKLKRLYPLIED
jgi:transposase